VANRSAAREQAKRILVVDRRVMIPHAARGHAWRTRIRRRAEVEPRPRLGSAKNATSTLRTSTPISTARPVFAVPMPYKPAARRSSLPRAMTSAGHLLRPADAKEAVPIDDSRG